MIRSVPDSLFDTDHNRPVTWDHLLRQTSDWRGTLFGKPDWVDRFEGEIHAPDPPGEAWEYKDVRVNLLAVSLLHVLRDPLQEVLREEIMDPIGSFLQNLDPLSMAVNCEDRQVMRSRASDAYRSEGRTAVATFLLTWNPERDGTRDIGWARELEARSDHGETVEFSWSCGRTKAIERGDRAVFLRQGLEPRGVLAVGRVMRGPHEAEHWRRDADAETVQMVKVRWAHFAAEPVIPRERLNERPLDAAHWDVRGSGVSVSDDVADALMDEFWEAAGVRFDPLPDDKSGTAGNGIAEGAPMTGTASGYERSAKAREACLVAHGMTCKVCDVGMDERYGPAAAGLVHVHHLEPLASVGEQHRVDPVRDLRPVCPNCHAVIHHERPPSSPRTINEVRRMLAEDAE